MEESQVENRGRVIPVQILGTINFKKLQSHQESVVNLPESKPLLNVRDRAHTTYPERGELEVSRNTTLGLRGGGGSRPGYVVLLSLPFYCILAVLTEFAHRTATRLICTFSSLCILATMKLASIYPRHCPIAVSSCDDCGPAEQNLSQCFFIDSLFCSIRCVLFYF